MSNLLSLKRYSCKTNNKLFDRILKIRSIRNGSVLTQSLNYRLAGSVAVGHKIVRPERVVAHCTHSKQLTHVCNCRKFSILRHRKRPGCVGQGMRKKWEREAASLVVYLCYASTLYAN